MKDQQTLFKFPQLRRSNGQFCTREQLRIERVDEENKMLRINTERYRRAWLAASRRASRLDRELKELKDKIKEMNDV